MTESNFCDFQGSIDSNMMSSMVNYSHRGGGENFDGSHKSGPGFYTEQFPMTAGTMDALSSHSIAAMAMNMPGTSSGVQPDMSGLGTLATASAARAAEQTSDYSGLQGYYMPESGYPMKGEKHMPPTPPGSPEEAMSMMQQGGMGNLVAMQQNMLAKPVPMRRLSEKRIAQARACLNTVSGMMSDPIMDPTVNLAASSNPALARALTAVTSSHKRPRSEKKAIPDEHKDDKYFERRKRNNNAAKKSRDSRKAREDEIAIRASFLEKENAILRAQVATLREEANSLRQLLLQKRARH